MALSNKVSVFIGKTGQILSVNPFFGKRIPSAPSGYKLFTFDRPSFGGSPVSDDAIETDYEIVNEDLVRK